MFDIVLVGASQFGTTFRLKPDRDGNEGERTYPHEVPWQP